MATRAAAEAELTLWPVMAGVAGAVLQAVVLQRQSAELETVEAA
jgi:hypothetical protein